MQVITGWELGTGPCGTNCKANRVGTSTLAYRRLNDKVNFGNYTLDAKVNSNSVFDISINDKVMNTMQESVLDVSESEKWEQVIATFAFELNGTVEVDIR